MAEGRDAAGGGLVAGVQARISQPLKGRPAVPRMPIDQLVALDEDEQGEAFVWIDWRSGEDEVVTDFAEQLDPADTLTFREDGDRVVPILRGVEHPVPLTLSGSDRYVMIHSLAELLKDRYTFWRHADSAGSDTHGFLVLRNDEASELQQRHPKWVKKNLETLTPGVDGFSGLDIPWWGHEHHAPGFAGQRRAMDADLDRLKDRVHAITGALRDDARDNSPPGETFLMVLAKQRWAVAAYAGGALLSALVALSDAVPAGVATTTCAVAAAMFALSAVFHAVVVSRMRKGWRPPLWVRIAPAMVIMVLLVLAPMLLPSG